MFVFHNANNIQYFDKNKNWGSSAIIPIKNHWNGY